MMVGVSQTGSVIRQLGELAERVAILARRALVGSHRPIKGGIVGSKENPLLRLHDEDFIPGPDMKPVGHVPGERGPDRATDFSQGDLFDHAPPFESPGAEGFGARY